MFPEFACRFSVHPMSDVAVLQASTSDDEAPDTIYASRRLRRLRLTRRYDMRII